MDYDVFVSYSSKDKPTADAVCAVLESHGIRCWIAPRDILPGQDWGGSIIQAIKGARAMVLVFSASANTSNQIKREVERAVSKGMPVIPLRIENVLPSETLEFFISTPHWLDAFTPPIDRHLQYLAEVVRKIIGGAEVSSPVAERHAHEKADAETARIVEEKRKATEGVETKAAGAEAREGAEAELAPLESERTTEHAEIKATEQKDLAAEAKRRRLSPRASEPATPSRASMSPSLKSAAPAVAKVSKASMIIGSFVGIVALTLFAYVTLAPSKSRNAQTTQATQKSPPIDRAESHVEDHGAIIITTDPPGAIVTLAEESRKSPAAFKRIKVGTVAVKAEMDGYEPAEQHVRVEANSVNEPGIIKLVRSTGSAQVSSIPSGIDFDLLDADGEHHKGKTPSELTSLPVGNTRITFTPNSAAAHFEDIKIVRNRAADVSWRVEVPSPPPAFAASNLSFSPPSMTGRNFTNSLGRTMVWIPTLQVWVCETEVTQGDFISLMERNPSAHTGPDLPVDSVTALEAIEFCQRLTKREAGAGILPSGYHYTLPTDSQWTTLCGNASLSDAVTSQERTRSGPAPVKSLGPNEYGLYDTRGNVWEWTRTPYSIGLNTSAIQAEYPGLDPNGLVLRGGSWRSKGDLLRVTTRGSNKRTMRDNTNGFRIVLAPQD